uniref:Integration host factor subunit beta n=1 Tax=candidate division WOR-3 bacterium TaxID=2052148 RepID=A0A7C3J646_UNCW3
MAEEKEKAKTRTKADVIDQIAERTGVMRRDVEICFETLIDLITETLVNRDRIEIRGLGVFKTKKRRERIARHPKTGAKVHVPERYVPAFKPSKILKEKVEKR